MFGVMLSIPGHRLIEMPSDSLCGSCEKCLIISSLAAKIRLQSGHPIGVNFREDFSPDVTSRLVSGLSFLMTTLSDRSGRSSGICCSCCCCCCCSCCSWNCCCCCFKDFWLLRLTALGLLCFLSTCLTSFWTFLKALWHSQHLKILFFELLDPFFRCGGGPVGGGIRSPSVLNAEPCCWGSCLIGPDLMLTSTLERAEGYSELQKQ